jgi:hypothetical protein
MGKKMFFSTKTHDIYITVDAITTMWYIVDTNDLHIRVLNISIVVSKK